MTMTDTTTNWDSVINAQPGYVLYIEHDDAPHDVSIHTSLSGAEAALREYAERFFGETVPVDKDIVEGLAEYSEYARIYKCGGPDINEPASVEIEPFADPLDADKAA
jgi:hypothetical protein